MAGRTFGGKSASIISLKNSRIFIDSNKWRFVNYIKNFKP
jgi:hypothetical protein